MLKARINQYLEEFFESRPDLFLIDLKISESGQVKVLIDGDTGVKLKDCVALSRHIEGQLTETDDVALEVSSAGASSPLLLPRQYAQHHGRKLEVTDREGATIKGQLTEVTKEEIELTEKIRIPKPVGKGKVTVEQKTRLAFGSINKAMVVLEF